MRTLYIHIGQPKTGSSSIQRFLVDNRAALLEAGLGLGPYMTLASGKSLPLRRAIERQGLAAVMAELAASPGESLVISSEHLCDILGDEARAEAIRDAARPHFRPVVVVFLRRQDFWHESLYAQEVKTVYADTIEAYTAAALADPEYDYDGGVARLERVFGPGTSGCGSTTTGVRTTWSPTSSARSSWRSTAARAGDAPRQNASPHRRKVLFLSQVPKPDPAIQDLSAFMTGVVEKTGAIADDGVRFLLAPRDRHRLVAAHAAGNRALAARYGLDDRGQFATPPDPAADWSPPRPITAPRAPRGARRGDARLRPAARPSALRAADDRQGRVALRPDALAHPELSTCGCAHAGARPLSSGGRAGRVRAAVEYGVRMDRWLFLMSEDRGHLVPPR